MHVVQGGPGLGSAGHRPRPTAGTRQPRLLPRHPHPTARRVPASLSRPAAREQSLGAGPEVQGGVCPLHRQGPVGGHPSPMGRRLDRRTRFHVRTAAA